MRYPVDEIYSVRFPHSLNPNIPGGYVLCIALYSESDAYCAPDVLQKL
jgi:hypothetical protein